MGFLDCPHLGGVSVMGNGGPPQTGKTQCWFIRGIFWSLEPREKHVICEMTCLQTAC